MLDTIDPLVFLDIDTSKFKNAQELQEMRKYLRRQIGEYLMLNLAKNLTWEQQEILIQEKQKDTLLEKMRLYIPDFDEKVSTILKQFKEDFNNKLAKHKA